jgi:hypothetical protein
MACKVTQNGIICKQPTKRETEHEEECLHCDGCGMVTGRVCKSCNGHGVIVFDGYTNKAHSYSLTEEQLAAMKTLGGVA